MPRTESESLDDEEILMFPIVDVGLDETTEDTEDNKEQFVSLRQRRQIKLGIRKVLPLNVLIPNAHVTDKNKRWYEALKKVWHHKDPWNAFHLGDLEERNAIRHRYNPQKKKWHTDNVKVKMEGKPFNRGAMRQCYRLKKLSHFCHSSDWNHAGNYVAKKYIESVDRSVYFEDVKLQMDAKLWAEEYNRHNPPKKIDIFQMYIIELIEEEGSPLYHLEHFIEGEYIKYNSNSGFVEETGTCRQTPQAFSHFTFERSGHELIIVDVQGVGDLYTDPQIHTFDGLQYGDGNLGTKGMALFFNSHHCNDICRALGLEEFDLSEKERDAINNHTAGSPLPMTEVRGSEDHVVSPTNVERVDLTRMLSNPRPRCLSSVSDLGSLPEDESYHQVLHSQISQNTDNSEKETSPDHSIDSGLVRDRGEPGALLSPSDAESRERHLSHGSGHSDECACHKRTHLYSTSSDDYPYETSESCASSLPSNAASLTKLMEEKLYGLHTNNKRPSNITSEHFIRYQAEHLGDSILGQVHHEIAKYHEIGRFAPDANEQKIDWNSALFHEDHAAMLGVPEAIVTMAKIYLHIPHDVLVSCVVPETEENTNKGVDYMNQAAAANDRASIIYMAKAYETGEGLGTKREKSYKESVELYQRAIFTQDPDDHGEFDATMADPNYLLLAKQADMYREGGFGLEKDPNRAGELYTEAADEAMAAMKGRLANQYYMKAEEAYGDFEE